jgi:hypothetical protein
MWPLAVFLMLVVAFYWGAFYISAVAWLNAVGHLFRGNFIRAAAWFSIGVGMLLWWKGSDVIPDPWDFDKWLRGSAVVVGIGALATFVRWRKKQQAMQTIPTMPVWTPPFEANGNIAPIIEVEYKRLSD